jgi:hypothetical protein
MTTVSPHVADGREYGFEYQMTTELESLVVLDWFCFNDEGGNDWQSCELVLVANLETFRALFDQEHENDTGPCAMRATKYQIGFDEYQIDLLSGCILTDKTAWIAF